MCRRWTVFQPTSLGEGKWVCRSAKQLISFVETNYSELTGVMHANTITNPCYRFTSSDVIDRRLAAFHRDVSYTLFNVRLFWTGRNYPKNWLRRMTHDLLTVQCKSSKCFPDWVHRVTWATFRTEKIYSISSLIRAPEYRPPNLFVLLICIATHCVTLKYHLSYIGVSDA